MAPCSFCLAALAVPSPLPALSQVWSDFGFTLTMTTKMPYFLVRDPKADPVEKWFKVDRAGHGLPGEWIFRIVRRPDEMEGFAVVANGLRERIMYLIAVFGFCVEPGAPVGPIRGLRIVPDAGSRAPLDLAAQWIDNCATNHTHCTPQKGRLPSRVLDLDALDDPDRVRLWETKGAASCHYVALSHCWGAESPGHVTTTHATLEDHLQAILVQSLPQTFQDAIKATRHLGIRYLWIDSLCICQDDVDDWARESASMTDVYAGAHVMIAADMARESAYGFFKRPERSYVSVDLVVSPEGTGSGTAAKSPDTTISVLAFEVLSLEHVTNQRIWLELQEEPLTSRAWAFQERLLPHRVLHFATDQLFFECNNEFLSEDGVVIRGRWNSLYPGESASWIKLARMSRVSNIHQLWYFILEDFTHRALTMESDRFPAISGLSMLIKQMLNSKREDGDLKDIEYVAGLWSNSLVEGLGWASFRRTDDRVVLPDTSPLPGDRGYIAPTWSWASFPGGSAHGATMEGWVDVAIATGWSVTPKNKQNPHGEVLDGWISLRGPMLKLELSDGPGSDEEDGPEGWHRSMRFRTPRGNREGAYACFDGIYGGHSQEMRD
ncbi:hypothetical protein ACJZ2D_012819 [Fusarium nematophilum]